jgi:hypothetical protein
MSHAELKSLETRKKRVNQELIVRKGEQVRLSKEINHLIQNVREIESKIKKLKVKKITNNSITITEHAILRYLERVEGIDIERVKKDIVTEEVLQQIKTLGAGTYPVKGKYNTIDKQMFKIRVRDNAVITVLTKE